MHQSDIQRLRPGNILWETKHAWCFAAVSFWCPTTRNCSILNCSILSNGIFAEVQQRVCPVLLGFLPVAFRIRCRRRWPLVPLGATRGGRPRCLVRANISKKWYCRPEEITIQITNSASACEVLETLMHERDNPGLNLIDVAAAWDALANFGQTVPAVVRKMEKDPMMDELVDLAQRILKRSLFKDLTPPALPCATMFWASAKLTQGGLLRQHLASLQEGLNVAVVATSV